MPERIEYVVQRRAPASVGDRTRQTRHASRVASMTKRAARSHSRDPEIRHLQLTTRQTRRLAQPSALTPPSGPLALTTPIGQDTSGQYPYGFLCPPGTAGGSRNWWN
jgi:hypothetical protein